MVKKKLKAPFPYFGGKSRIASAVWDRLGDVNNYIEPFAGSAAMLLLRPSPPRVETLNDADCYVANFWRATAHDPSAVAEYADGPVNECDLHSRHRWLVLSDDAKEFRRRMRSEPEYYDSRIAGYWCWGMCCWIGGGWCAVPGETSAAIGCNRSRRPEEVAKGVHRQSQQVPRLSEHGNGIHALSKKLPKLSGDTRRPSVSPGVGVHASGGTHRIQLGDAYSRGRGVHGNDAVETCADRRAWLLDWFGRLRDRLRNVRVCCGDWSRVCSSESTTTRFGITGVFLDPPYGASARRDADLYAVDSLDVAPDLRRWCLRWGKNRLLRIALCGYEGEGHEELETAGWNVIVWKAHGGYGNRSEVGKANAKKERIWFSPHCLNEPTLFDSLKENKP